MMLLKKELLIKKRKCENKESSFKMESGSPEEGASTHYHSSQEAYLAFSNRKKFTVHTVHTRGRKNFFLPSNSPANENSTK